MAQKKRKPVLAKQPESTTSTRLLQLMFLASYVALGYLFFIDGDLPIIGGIIILDFIISIGYGVSQRKHILTSTTAQYNIRMILSFLITLITTTFYALALVRSDQTSVSMKTMLVIVGACVYLAVLSSSKGIIQQYVEREQ